MTGYFGRIGLYEIMSTSAASRTLVRTGADLAKLRDQAYRDGMKPLRASGALKVARGRRRWRKC
jgi:general secretion pathway protein E